MAALAHEDGTHADRHRDHMRCLGVDPSSSFGGVAIVDAPSSVKNVAHWQRPKNSSHPQGLQSWFEFMRAYIRMYRPHMASIEMHAYSGPKSNQAASHAVAYYQGVAAVCCKLEGLVVIEVRATTSRRIVLGRGNISKEDAWTVMRKRYPDLFSPKTRGGLDEMDALIASLAGPDAAES